jgi:tetratricopeptide (TPR) repeat protein
MVLAGADARPEELARFRVEIEAVARLQHPNIVQIYEVGEQDGRPFFVMEYADGGNLSQQLQGTPLSVQRAAHLVELLGRAIHYAHQRGIIHRDLTPANILLMADGTPKITDFGLAKILIGGGTTQTHSGMILGTPSYMPPEQAAGRTHEVGPTTDVYALGAILYEMLTGRPPFRGETPLETVRQVGSDEPVPPRRLQPKLAQDLETICLKCLQKESRKRFGSAQELADVLQRFLSNRPIAARRTSLPERTWRWCRRNPMVATLTTSVGLLLVIVALVSSVSAVWLREQRNDATEKLWISYVAQAKAGRFSRRQGQRFESVKALEEAAKIGRKMKMEPERLAWFYVTGPMELRAPDKALPLAQQALKLEPESSIFRNTLGVVYYRLQRYGDAVACFEKNLSEDTEYAGFDLLFLAMSYQGLQQSIKARECHAQARQWFLQQTNLTTEVAEELKSLQAEADTVVKGAKP